MPKYVNYPRNRNALAVPLGWSEGMTRVLDGTSNYHLIVSPTADAKGTASACGNRGMTTGGLVPLPSPLARCMRCSLSARVILRSIDRWDAKQCERALALMNPRPIEILRPADIEGLRKRCRELVRHVAGLPAPDELDRLAPMTRHPQEDR